MNLSCPYVISRVDPSGKIIFGYIKNTLMAMLVSIKWVNIKKSKNDLVCPISIHLELAVGQ